MTGVRIEALLPEHAEQVPGIYRAGIDEGSATFETRASRERRQSARATRLAGQLTPTSVHHVTLRTSRRPSCRA
ncbi:hypothetical protein Slala02_05760 [Streptomyces lavendulae subsp. lavendulae]|nr:hypothetical protein Slala01_10290 [Streptomyces lavendulae subsp. lavendulae]GLX24756.1 hypothetical protein Slala02_05760 [Streptomyces lavendulae subsp. lavendulae]